MKNDKKMWAGVLLCFTLVCAVAMTALGKEAEGTETKRVLFLSSYSMSFDSVPLQLEGIREVLTPDIAQVDAEFMDTKRFYKEEDILYFHDGLKRKLSRLPVYDAVILGDDAALQFAIDYQDELFDGIPMVFLGVNSVSLAREAEKIKNITGSIEAPSYEDNIRLAKQLQPEAKRIIALVDNTATGIGDAEQFYAQQSNFPELQFDDINSNDYTFEELGRKLEELGDDTIVFYLSMFQDKNGVDYTIRESSRLIREHTHVPVYRLSIGGVGDGLLGGIMFSYKAAGEKAGEILRRVWSGTDINTIEVDMVSPNFGYFDNHILTEYGISRNMLPPGSTIINQSSAFYEQNKRLITVMATLFGICAFAALWLMIDNQRRKQLMNQDYLTGLMNRMCMMGKMEKLLYYHEPFAVILLDLDDFKRINDTFGHTQGDELLIQVSGRLQGISGDEIWVSRFGGDEFLAVVLTDERDKAEQAAEKIQEIFAAPFFLDGKRQQVHVSMGIARAPLDGQKSAQLISCADMSMYTVKGNGKNGYAFFDKEMLEEVRRQEIIKTLLRDAIENDEFCMHYQPQVSAATGRVVGFEALLRMTNCDIPPAEFIPVAEQTGMIVKIGRAVTRKVLEQMGRWRESGFDPGVVAINFSNCQLRDREYPEYLQGLLEKYKIPAQQLEIEITESVFLKKADYSINYLSRLSEMGVRLALDDFGTGYSAIGYLTYVPIGMMKLDKSLIDRFLHEDEGRTVENIIRFAHGLNIEVTAEGVEEPVQYAMLKRVECDYVQGYLFSRPVPAAEISANFLDGAIREKLDF